MNILTLPIVSRLRDGSSHLTHFRTINAAGPPTVSCLEAAHSKERDKTEKMSLTQMLKMLPIVAFLLKVY